MRNYMLILFLYPVLVFGQGDSITVKVPMGLPTGIAPMGTRFMLLSEPSAIRYLKINASNDVVLRTAAEMLSDIGAQAAGSYQPLATNLTTIGGLANGNGFLKNNGSGTFSYENPAGSGTVTDFIFTNGGGFTGNVTTSTSTPTLSLTFQNAAADGSTKGQASFTAADFDASSGNIGIDYTNGQAASGSTKGFLTSADWTTFNGKLATNGNGGSLTGLTATQVGLGNVTNESKATMFTSPTFTGTPVVPSAITVGGNTITFPAVAATLLPNTTTSGVAATATASGTTTVTHNLGRTPTTIRIKSISSFTSNAAATPVPFSEGTWNSTGNRCLYMVINGTTSQVSQTSTVFSVIMVTSAGNQITGVIGNVTSTGFDIVWTETGTHTAGNYLWEAQ